MSRARSKRICRGTAYLESAYFVRGSFKHKLTEAGTFLHPPRSDDISLRLFRAWQLQLPRLRVVVHHHFLAVQAIKPAVLLELLASGLHLFPPIDGMGIG